MRLARLVAVLALLPGVLPAQDQRAARAGHQALFAGAYTTAVYFLKQAVEAEPRHLSAWKDLCGAYLALDQVEAAIDACHRQIDVYPDGPEVYRILSQALWRKGKRDEAISALRRQIEIDPEDWSAHAGLGHLYCELEKYAEAVPELETAVAMKPNNALGQEDLGGAYLALGEIDKGLAMLNKLAQDQPTATTLNSVAYRLASHRVRLDLAQRYAATALTSTETALAAGAEAPPTLGALRQVSMLSHCWDTLGWVHFQQGNLDEAERFIAAAWSANPDGPIGDHLGRIYERRGQKHEALRAYARALAGPGALPQTRRRLEALVGAGEAAPEVDRLVAAVPAGKLLAETASADFYLVQARKPAVAEAQFIRGDDRLRPFFKVVQEVTPAAILPGATPTRLVRRVTLTCPGEGRDSSIELLPASAAVLAELNAIPPDTHLASEQTPGAPAVYHIGGDGVTNPVAIYMPEPQYSKEALKKRIQGTVTLHIVVDRAGNPRNFKVIQGLGYGLDEKAIEAVSQWKFRPGMKDGQTVNVAATINVSFRLQNDH